MEILKVSRNQQVSINDINAMQNGKSLLYHCIQNKDYTLLSFLITQGASTNKICDEKTGNYPLHEAFKVDCYFCIMALLLDDDNKADFNCMNKAGYTPLGYGTAKTLKKLDL